MQNPDSGQGESTKKASGSAHSVNNAPNSGEMKPPGFDAVSVLWTFGKCLGALLPVYLAGYYRVSASFLVFGLMVYTGWRHSREAKEARLRSAIHLYDNEQQYTSMNIFKSKKDLPAWAIMVLTSQSSKIFTLNATTGYAHAWLQKIAYRWTKEILKNFS